MTLAVKLTLLAAGVFLLVGLLTGVMKYWGIVRSDKHRAPYYIDIAHRAALMYSFAALVMAELLKYSPYEHSVQLVITLVPLFLFAVSIAQYIKLGIQDKTNNQFRDNNPLMTLGMIAVIIGEVGGVAAIVWGFVSTQLL